MIRREYCTWGAPAPELMQVFVPVEGWVSRSDEASLMEDRVCWEVALSFPLSEGEKSLAVGNLLCIKKAEGELR